MTGKVLSLAGSYPALVTATLTVALLGTAPSPAGETGSAEAEFFEKRIRPVLVEKCYACHSAEAQQQNKLRARLRLDTRAGLRAGGANGPVVVAGKPADSLLMQALQYDGPVKMPPKGKLPDTVIADFEAWIKNGAVDPRPETPVVGREPRAIDIEKGRDFWAYRRPAKVTPPTVKAA